MRKTLIALVAVLLVVVLAFGMFACNNTPKTDDNKTENNGSGTDTNTDNNGSTPAGPTGGQSMENVSADDIHYVAPTVGTLTGADIRDEVYDVAVKVYGAIAEEDDEPLELPDDICNLIAYILNESGVDRALLKKYVATADTLWTTSVSPLINDAKEADEDTDALEFAKQYVTEENIATALGLLNTVLTDVDTNKAVALTGSVIMIISASDFYQAYDFDVKAAEAALTAKGIDPVYLRSTTYFAATDLMKADYSMYVATSVLNMLKNLSVYSAAELKDAALVVMAVVDEMDSLDGNFMQALSAKGLGETSYKDLVKVINTAGGVLESMLHGINDVELGKALVSLSSHLAALTGGENTVTKAQILLAHPELLRTVAGILKNVTSDQLASLYIDFDDYNVKQKTDNGAKAFAVLVANIVNLVKADYAAIPAATKTALFTFLGDATLAKDVDDLIAAVPADKESVTAEQVTAINTLIKTIMGKVDLSIGEREKEVDGEIWRMENIPAYVVASATVSERDFLALLDKVGAYWYREEPYDRVSLGAEESPVTVTFAVVDGYATLSGEGVETVSVRLADAKDVVVRSNYDNIIRLALNAEEDEIKEIIFNSLSERFSYYHKVWHITGREYVNLTTDMIDLTAFDTSAVGKAVAMFTVDTPCGVAYVPVSVVVYDPENLQIEQIRAETETYRIAKGSEQSALAPYANVYYDDGSSRRITEGFTVSGFTAETRGMHTITMTYEGKTDTTRYYVYDPDALVDDHISVDKDNNYVSIEDAVDEATLIAALGLKVYLVKDDYKTKTEITEGYKIEGIKYGVAGWQEARVTYGKMQTWVSFSVVGLK